MITLPHRETRAGQNDNSAGPDARNLTLRIVSAATLTPIVIAAAYADGWLFLFVCALGASGILWEWTRLVAGRSHPAILAPGLAALAAAMAFAGRGEAGAAAAVIGMGAVIAGVFAPTRPVGQPVSPLRIWAASGVLYAGAAFLGPALLRRDPEFGFLAFLFLAATVWTTDIFAYSIGRAVGGPLLWPRVSPKKTWAGAIGGLIGGIAGGTLVAYAGGIGGLATIVVIALMLSALTQIGDLLESAVKRRFGAKESSRLIPGHGGLMDRLDGFLVAALAALLVGILHQGTDSVGRGLLVW